MASAAVFEEEEEHDQSRDYTAIENLENQGIYLDVPSSAYVTTPRFLRSLCLYALAYVFPKYADNYTFLQQYDITNLDLYDNGSDTTKFAFAYGEYHMRYSKKWFIGIDASQIKYLYFVTIYRKIPGSTSYENLITYALSREPILD